jgi:hypothetical protein
MIVIMIARSNFVRTCFSGLLASPLNNTAYLDFYPSLPACTKIAPEIAHLIRSICPKSGP